MERKLAHLLTHLLRPERRSSAVSENRGGQLAADQHQLVAHSANCGILFCAPPSSGRSDRTFSFAAPQLDRENSFSTARAVGYFLSAATRLNDTLICLALKEAAASFRNIARLSPLSHVRRDKYQNSRQKGGFGRLGQRF
jgi:hypothetical protein